MKFFKDFLITYKNDLKACGFIGLIFLVIGLGFQFLVRVVDADALAFPVGSIVLMTGFLLLSVLVGGQGLVKHFNLDVSLGSTRRRVILMFCLLMLVECLFELACIHFVFRFEGFLTSNVFKIAEEEGAFEAVGFFVGKIWILLLFASAWSILLGALTLRFGNKVYLISYFFFMLMIQLPALLKQIIPEEKFEGIGVFFRNILGESSFMPVILILLVIFVIGGSGVTLLRKQRVTL